MTQSNTTPLGGRKYLLSPRVMMAIEVPQNEEISGGGRNEGRKGVGFALRQRIENMGSINIKK